MQFISFSSGSSGNCYLLRSSGGTLLLDAGLSPRKVKQYLSAYGLSLSDIDAILITHDHTDHIKGAGLLAEECGCPVYTTQAVRLTRDLLPVSLTAEEAVAALNERAGGMR